MRLTLLPAPMSAAPSRDNDDNRNDSNDGDNNNSNNPNCHRGGTRRSRFWNGQPVISFCLSLVRCADVFLVVRVGYSSNRNVGQSFLLLHLLPLIYFHIHRPNKTNETERTNKQTHQSEIEKWNGMKEKSGSDEETRTESSAFSMTHPAISQLRFSFYRSGTRIHNIAAAVSFTNFWMLLATYRVECGNKNQNPKQTRRKK